MADAFLSLILGQLSTILQQELEQEVRLVLGVGKDVERMTTTLRSIQAVLNDAELRQFKEELVKIWLEELKNVAYDMDDVLDEWSTQILMSKIEGITDEAGVLMKKVCSYLFFLCNCFKQVPVRYDIAHKIKDIKNTLEVIANEKDKFQLNVTGRTEEAPREMTSSVLDVLEPRGRSQDTDIIKSKLLSESSLQAANGVPVISIVGFGGIGKTTLARMVFNDTEVKRKFEKTMWVCVSDPFDKMRIARAIIEEAGDREEIVHVFEWQALHQCLTKSVGGKRFLLVLDDVWNEDENKWSLFKHSLDGGAQGSRILVTTRHESVAKKMSSIHLHNLNQLSEEDCWLLFSRIAFQGRSEEDCKRLEQIGKEITKKCKGVPLYAKALGGVMLFKKTRQQWQEVLRSDTWELSEVGRDVLPALLLSYNALPSHLKRCFTYCAIFPKDFAIDKDMLIKLWMAQGLLSSAGGREAEVLGAEYFDNLVMRSFFQDFKRDNYGNIRSCNMHDLIHDFAQFLTKTECSVIDGSSTEFNLSIKLRHLYIHTTLDSTLPIIKDKLNNLRTLILYDEKNSNVPVLSDLFRGLTCLRALTIKIEGIEELPNEVEKLIHLRYFDLSGTELKELPEAMSKLCNLQTLKLNYCLDLSKLPPWIGKLINLRHIEFEGRNSLRYLPQGIGRLSSLRSLSKFIVGGVSEGGCKIGELKELNLLQGDLKIIGLESVAGVNEANEAKLKNKEHLRGLRLIFKGGDGSEEMEESEDGRIVGVLEGLQPHPNLENLEIQDYSGSMFPSWMVDAMLPNLLDVKLFDCRKCVQLPALWKFQFLERLNIRNMDGVIKLLCSGTGGVFLRLEDLVIAGMDNLEELNFRVKDGEIMPRLCSIELSFFPKLKVLPALGNLPILKTLEIRGMSAVKHMGPEFLGIDDADGGSLTVFPSLETLSIDGMDNLEELNFRVKDGGIMPSLCYIKLRRFPKLKVLPALGNLPVLKRLEIRGMSAVKHMGPEFLGIDDADGGSLTVFPSLETLSIDGMDNLEELNFRVKDGGIMPSLCYIKLQRFPKLKVLPALGNLPVLKRLEIRGMSAVKHMGPEFLGIDDADGGSLTVFPSLETLSIDGMDNLEELNFRVKDGGIMPSLCYIKLQRFPKLKVLPALGNLPVLKALKICRMSAVKHMGPEFLGIDDADGGSLTVFPSLETLSIDGMDNLEEWNFRVKDGEIMPRLCGIDLEDFPKLKVLPALGNLPVLKTLDIWVMSSVKRVGPEFLGIDGTKRESGESSVAVAFSHLEELTFRVMHEWEEWEMLTREDEEHAAGGGRIDFLIMPRIFKLSLYDCPRLEKLPNPIITSCSLRELTIGNCPKLTQIPSLPPLLEELNLEEDAGVLSMSLLPTGGTNNNHLKYLYIWDSPHSSLPEGLVHFKALQKLDIRWCYHFGRRYLKNGGEDWKVISHIPEVIIDRERQ